MHNRHARNTVRYYILFAVLLAFLFFSNDFGLIDVQKTAIVLAVGIDREEEEFILTSQIAIPQSSTQGKATQAVQIVSRGKTVADAFEKINAKTGWYPKLVFCKLILLGKNTVQQNVFDALDFFLRDEYLTDDCLVATCDDYAKTLLDTQALVDPSSSLAITKVLSDHAQRVGTVLPTSLREFSIGYFGDSKSGFLPIIKTNPQKENAGENTGGSSNGSSGGSSDSSSGSSDSASGNTSDSQGGQTQDKSSQEKPVFSARETALFVAGKRVETLTENETFAVSAVLNNLELASYSVEEERGFCTLSVKHSSPKLKFTVGKDGRASLKIEVSLTAGVSDYSKSQPLDDIADAGDISKDAFPSAEKKLAGEIATSFEKCKSCGCDLFQIQERLVKYKHRRLSKYKEDILQNTHAEISVRFQSVR